MKDWGKRAFEEWMYEKFIPEIIEDVRSFTGYSGDFPIEFKRGWNPFYRGPKVKGKYNLNRPEEVKVKTIIERPKLSSNSPWDVFFKLWSLCGECLHYVDIMVTDKKNFQDKIERISRTSTECLIHRMAYGITREYMKKKYPEWMKKNEFVFKEIDEVLEIEPEIKFN